MTTPSSRPPLLTHTDPPSDPGVIAGHLAEALRDAAEHATRRADEAPQIARDVAHQAARETTRRWVVWVIVAASLVAACMSWASLAIASRVAAEQAADAAAAEAVLNEQQRQLDGLRTALGKANGQLLAQGKPVVLPPADDPDLIEALAALVTARVRATLPAGTAAPGPQGVGIDSIRPVRLGGRCFLAVRLINPASGGITQQNTGPVGDSVCGVDTPPRTTTVTAPPPATPPTRSTAPTTTPAPTPTPAPAPTTPPGTRGASPTPSASAPASSAHSTTTTGDKPALPTLPTR